MIVAWTKNNSGILSGERATITRHGILYQTAVVTSDTRQSIRRLWEDTLIDQVRRREAGESHRLIQLNESTFQLPGCL